MHIAYALTIPFTFEVRPRTWTENLKDDDSIESIRDHAQDWLIYMLFQARGCDTTNFRTSGYYYDFLTENPNNIHNLYWPDPVLE